MNPFKTESHRRARPFLVAAMIAGGGCQLISGAGELTFDDSSAGPGGMAGAGGVAGAPASGGGGSGGAPECEEASECPGVETTCAYRLCEAGACGSATADAGAPCHEDGGSFCDGMGACVECLTPEHCEDGFVCQAKSCVPLSCTNRRLDPDESDVDCGGICPDCENGLSCNTFEDCESAFCDDGTSGSGGAGGTGGAGGGGGAGGSGGAGGAGGSASSGKQCAPCSAHDDCAAAPNSYCDGGVCLPQEILGAACADDATCLSGHCADGVCCDQACDSGCVSCLGSQTGALNGSCDAVTAGTDPAGECLVQPPSSCGAAGQGCNGEPSAPGCILYDSATVCVPASCDPVHDEATLPAHCDGSGTCEATVVESCFPFECNAALTACRTDCNGDTDCDAGGYCEGNLCLSKQAPGASCTLAKQCQSGFCVDGVCCDTGCGGTCRACSQTKTGQPSGTCAYIPNNQDPDNECFLSSCNGSGACAL